MEITRNTESYNQRRYGKPWIARVDFSTNNKGDFHWGDFIGDYRNGSAGVLVVYAEPKDLVVVGQKDNRKLSSSTSDYYVVQEDGSLELLGDKGKAFKYFLDNKGEPVIQSSMLEPLLKEKEELLNRLSEIEKLINLQRENNEYPSSVSSRARI